MTPVFVAFVVRPGYGRDLVRLEGPHREARLLMIWERVYQDDEAGVWGITAAGVWFGSRRGNPSPPLTFDQRAPTYLSVCRDCSREFSTDEANDPLCPGCAISVRRGEDLADNGGDWCAAAGLGQPHYFPPDDLSRCFYCLKTKDRIAQDRRDEQARI